MLRITTIITLFIIAGCDPAQVLIIEGPRSEGFVEVYGDSATLVPRSYSSKGKLQISAQENTQRSLFYGLGGWNNDELLTEYAAGIDSIVVKREGEERVLKNQSEIAGYLLSHRSGFAKRKLIIRDDF